MSIVGKALAMVLPVIMLLGAALIFLHPSVVSPSLGAPSATSSAHRQATQSVSLPVSTGNCRAQTPKLPLVGVAPKSPWKKSYHHFVAVTKVHPGLVAQYVSFGSNFDAQRACMIARQGGLMLIQMNPRHAPLTKIATGYYDAYLTKYARAIRTSGLPVVFSFAHEMNGHWYPWGYQHTPPSVFIAAWRHIHRVFEHAGAKKVIWCWNPNGIILSKTAEASPRAWWPGSAYVNWVGIDAYFNTPTETYATAISPSIAEVRKFTKAPILIAETAVARGPEEDTQIKSLFAGIKSSRGIVGFVWFDRNKREVWHIEGRPTAVAAFRQGANTLSPASRG